MSTTILKYLQYAVRERVLHQMKPNSQAARVRPVVAVTLSPMALKKLESLKKHYGKTALSHAVEKIIEDTFERLGNAVGTVPGADATIAAPATTNPRLNEPEANYRVTRPTKEKTR